MILEFETFPVLPHASSRSTIADARWSYTHEPAPEEARIVKFFPRGLSASCLVFLVALATNGHADDAPALTIRLIRPDEQGMHLIGLFRGAQGCRSRRCLGGVEARHSRRGSLGKPVEALISIGNPAMVREFRGLDGAEARIWFPAGASRPIWQAVAPRDDGSFAALATALALTDGAVRGTAR